LPTPDWISGTMKGQIETVLSFPEDCFVGGGQMGELMRSLDWSKTCIGAVETWSQALRMMVRILLANRFPMVLWWGPSYCQLYNDPYRPMLGKKHPRSMGQPAKECFPEIWDIIGSLIDAPFRGGSATWMEDLQLEVLRYDRLEESHFTFAHSPVPDDAEPSGIGGVLGTVHEITAQVLGERRGLVLRELGSRSGAAKTAEEACLIAARTLSLHPKDIPFALIYLLDADGKQAHLAGAAGIEMGNVESPLQIDLSGDCSPEAVWPLAKTVRSETMQIVENLQAKLPSVPPGPWSDPPRSAVVWPIRSDMAHGLAGFLVVGVSSRLRFDDRYRDFCELVTGQVASAIAYARAYEVECKRAAELEEIDRAKTAFFCNVSHEFRTPLTLMLGPLEEELRENGKGRERVEIAYRNGLRLLKLVNALLDFSRIEAERTDALYEPTDLAAATVELASVFRSAIEKAGLRLTVDSPPLPEEVYVDRDMWEKIVLNLLSNAFKFTFEGEIKISLGWYRDHVELSVRDTGVGIPAPELSRIFERFHRVRGTRSRSHEGTGIGLSLVQELVKMHGGEIQVRSVEGQGSFFTVAIPTGHAHLPKERLNGTRSLVSTKLNATPFVEEALRWSPSNTSSSASHPGELGLTISSMPSAGRAPSVRILFADDNADMRDYVRRLLEEQYEVETVGDGQAALESILANPPDLVLTDVMMPRLDGFGLLHALRADERTRTLPLIMLSARAGEEARVEGLIAGVDDYLIKPFSARELLARIGTHVEMTRLRRAAATALEESEKRLREMADHAPVMIWITDDHGNVEFVNRTYLQYFEVTLADVAGQEWTNLVHPGDLESYSQQLLAASAAGRSFRAEARLRRGDGEWRWVDSWAVPRSPERDRAPGMVVCSTDITERKRAEERIRELGAIVESSDDAILGESLDGIITSWNKGAEKIYGYSQKEVIGQPTSILASADSPAETQLILSRIARGEVVDHYETVQRKKGGEEIHVSLTVSLIRNREGKIVGASSVARDISGRKQIEGALRESEERFRELAEHIEEVFWISDPKQTHSFYVSPAYEKIWGRTCESLYASPRSWTEAIHPEDKERIMADLAKDRPGPYDLTYRIVLPGGLLRWIRDRGFPVHDETGQMIRIVGIAEDITQAKEAENALQQANAQLNVLSRRLFEVQEDERRHLSRELHDRMGQALTAVKIDLQSTQCLEEHTEIVRRLDDSIGALELLVQQARQLSLELRPPLLDDLGLVPALRWYLDQQAQRTGFHVKFFADPSLERVDVSLETVCFRVAQEALTNIIRHAHAQEVNVELHRTTETLHLVVRDDGIGFDVATAQQRCRQGASLGLLGMLERVALVGGEWDCKSAPGSGTEVHAFLPLQASDPQEPRP
jgi:PAS domain S-box-containing protein